MVLPVYLYLFDNEIISDRYRSLGGCIENIYFLSRIVVIFEIS